MEFSEVTICGGVDALLHGNKVRAAREL